jgi:hypothetical protein
MEKFDNKVVEEIFTGLQWYERNSTKCTIEKILNIQDKLSIRGYYLAEQLSEIKKEYNLAYFARKIEFNKAKKHYIDGGSKIGEAEPKATLDVKDIQEEEVMYESLGYRLEILLRQLNKILDSMAQRISYLKQEKQRVLKQDQT